MTIMNRNAKLGCCVVLALFLTGCAENFSVNDYSSSHVGAAADTMQGVIIKVRRVGITSHDNSVGTALGAVTGGVAGNMIGGGRGRVASTALGALAGGAIGNMAQKKMSSQVGLEYVVKLDNTKIVTVVQSTDEPLQVGQRVLVMLPKSSSQGRARVIAL